MTSEHNQGDSPSPHVSGITGEVETRMSEPIEAYPLQWPAGWPRTKQPEWSRFKTSFSAARDGVLNELRLLGARGIVISTNIPLRKDGLPYSTATKREPDDSGVAVYFTLDNESRCIPVDKWHRVGDNLHAVALTINALRGLDRWGAKEMVNAAFAGFAALPATTSGSSWWSVLGVAHDASDDAIDAAFRHLAKERHPDRGGTYRDWHDLNEAYRQAKRRSSQP